MTANEVPLNEWKKTVLTRMKTEKRFGEDYLIMKEKGFDDEVGAETESLYSVDTFVEAFHQVLLETELKPDNLHIYEEYSKKQELGLEKYLASWFRPLND